jgi:hypothetical protein
MEIWEVIAREEIRDLVTRYNSNSDTGRFPQLLELFDDTSVMTIDGGMPYSGTSEIINIFTNAKGRLDSVDVPKYIRHYVATHQIDIESETAARGRCYFAVLTHIGLDHWGRYIDTYKKVNGKWLFDARKVFVDGTSAGSTFVAKK